MIDSNLLIEILYLFLIGLVFAGLEIQIEGKDGWASALPSWRPSPARLPSKIYRALLFGKDITGYHLLIFTLLLTILHYPYFTGKAWDLISELKTFSYFFLLSIVWDFLWFILNPHYGLPRFFKRENIWWHKRWFLFLPIDYWFGLMISALLYPGFKEWLQVLALFLFLTLVVVVSKLIYGKFSSVSSSR